MANHTIYRDDKIRAAMAAKRLTNEEVAQKAGLSTVTVSFIRNGKGDAKISSLGAIATALDMELTELFEPRAA
jgi:transcriptional regulator with XRE-family HTH domain